MDIYYIFFNPYSCSGTGKEKTYNLKNILTDVSLKYFDITKIENMQAFVDGLDDSIKIVISGGDGTINNFINTVDIDNLQNEIYCYSAGNGNDFLRDIGMYGKDEIVLINNYLRDLPVATIKGKTYKFLNNVSFGIDGYCCEVADEQRKKSNKKVNYSLIAIKGLLGGYKSKNATVTVDGVMKHYKRVWLSPVMNGRYIGGGLKIAPDQDRLNSESMVSFVVMHDLGRIKCLVNFPKLLTGEHVKLTDHVEVIKGHDITVCYDEPAPVQIDGETIRNVLRYDVTSKCKSESKI